MFLGLRVINTNSVIVLNMHCMTHHQYCAQLNRHKQNHTRLGKLSTLTGLSKSKL